MLQLLPSMVPGLPMDVIVVVTKKAKEKGKTTVEVSGYVTIQISLIYSYQELYVACSAG
jgi:hypothetical protein